MVAYIQLTPNFVGDSRPTTANNVLTTSVTVIKYFYHNFLISYNLMRKTHTTIAGRNDVIKFYYYLEFVLKKKK